MTEQHTATEPEEVCSRSIQTVAWPPVVAPVIALCVLVLYTIGIF